MKKNHKIVSTIWENEMLLEKRYRALRSTIKNIRKFTEIKIKQESAEC
jgi:hypothetical protein